ncbi:hypothetical protein CEQ90_10915 [Lewinellaceae bacterium SD302]|nr:hypothetical protein CEQ90_10915 [Lewinellaceae bacterium SD302]
MSLSKFTSIILFLFLTTALAAQTSYSGRVVDEASGEGLPFATVKIKDSDRGTVTDVEGNFFLLNAPDSTTLLISYVGFTNYAVKVNASKADNLIVRLTAGTELDEVVVIDYRIPLIDADNTTQGRTVTAEEIRDLPTRDISSIAATAAGVGATDKGEAPEIRGSRSDASDYYVDGIRVEAKSKKEAAPATYSEAPLFEDVVVESASMAITADVAPAPSAEYDAISTELPAAGQLTAGEVNDFSKWNLWSDLRDEDLAQYRELWGYAPEKRYVAQLTYAGGKPVIDAVVELRNNVGKTIYRARTDNQGRAELWAELFPGQLKAGGQSRLTATVDGVKVDFPSAVPFELGINAKEIAGPCERRTAVEVAFVVDATGSMGDEMAYLKSELLDVMKRSQDSLTDQNVDFGAVYYRDEGEEYVTRHLPFGETFETVVDFAGKQSAGGGGDHPEAVDAALEVALDQLDWSETAAARLLFLVLDAPPHADPETVSKMQELGKRAAEKGIRIIPVVCSGMGQDGEYLLRSLALATNGTYTFLTDHSGIGGSHLEPSTDSYEVEKLNDLLVRLITQFGRTSVCNEDQVNSNIPIVNTTDDWSVYPNPTMGPVTVELPKREGHLFIVDGFGKILQRVKVTKKKQDLQFGQLPSGTYLVRWEYEGEVSTRRVVVVRA